MPMASESAATTAATMVPLPTPSLAAKISIPSTGSTMATANRRWMGSMGAAFMAVFRLGREVARREAGAAGRFRRAAPRSGG
ncbi:hypothetical protein JCM17961_07620 [Endothiovibrio diazotrophicus]